MKNVGKRFEENFKKSISDEYLLYRLKDSPQAFTQNNLTSFTHKNPCDYFLFDGKRGVFYCLELKTTKDIYDF